MCLQAAIAAEAGVEAAAIAEDEVAAAEDHPWADPHARVTGNAPTGTVVITILHGVTSVTDARHSDQMAPGEMMMVVSVAAVVVVVTVAAVVAAGSAVAVEATAGAVVDLAAAGAATEEDAEDSVEDEEDQTDGVAVTVEIVGTGLIKSFREQRTLEKNLNFV